MLWRSLTEGFHWLHLFFFKPLTFEARAEPLTRQEALRIFLKILPAGVVLLPPLALSELALFHLLGCPVQWVTTLVAPVGAWLLFGLVGISGAPLLGLQFGLFYALFIGLSFPLIIGSIWDAPSCWLVALTGVGIVLGLILAPMYAPSHAVDPAVGSTLLFSLGTQAAVMLLAGVIIWWAIDLYVALRVMLYYLLGNGLSFVFFFFRPFYLPLYALQYWQARSSPDPFREFHASPLYWDEGIVLPLPALTSWLLTLVKHDRERGLAEIRFVVEKRPLQRRAAQAALLELAVRELQQVSSLEQLAGASQLLEGFVGTAGRLSRDFDEARRSIDRFSRQAQNYLARTTSVGQVRILEDLASALTEFRSAMQLADRRVGLVWLPLADRWLGIVEMEAAESRKRLAFTPIPNPFIVGNPLQPRDQELFKGRTDIIAALEENIITPRQRPALLLYGRRRIGKTSTLLNLPRLISSQFVPVFLDCQDARWRESDAAFCYHLIAAIVGELDRRDLVNGLTAPRLEQFERYPFTQLDESLNRIERRLGRLKMQVLLTFDEYERLEGGITTGDITEKVLDQLRHLVQHREHIVVLFSGSHRFEEMQAVNWSDYLINVKMLELSFLSPQDARELVEHPVLQFNLRYEAGVVEQMLALTHRHPYLLQAMASELVNDLNAKKRMVAGLEDLEVAVEKVTVSAQAYFFYTWQEDCSAAEREVLWALARGEAQGLNVAQDPQVLQRLWQKEIVEQVDHRYRFTIELFRRWIVRSQLHLEPSTRSDDKRASR